MSSIRIAYVEWPDGLLRGDAHWNAIAHSVAAAKPDILITNELPFGPWIAESSTFSEADAAASIRAHEEGIEALSSLNLPAVVSSQPVRAGNRLANEAFMLEGHNVRPLHRKQYFPNEPGWYEAEWYSADDSGFHVAEIVGIKVGVLLCTDAMFNEHARACGKQGAALIAMPRASGVNLDSWKIAGAMASLVSGAYVVSSNRVGPSTGGTHFGGGGFAYAPHGKFLAQTSQGSPLQVFDLDPNAATTAHREYPCYVSERQG